MSPAVLDRPIIAPCRVAARYRALWLTKPAPSRSAALTGAIWEEAPRRLTHLGQRDGPGIFLANGGRLSLEPDGWLRFETPECRSPSLALLYIRAAEVTLLGLTGPVSEAAGLPIGIERARTSWEETFLTGDAVEHRPAQLLPFLISRLTYGGAGGFEPDVANLRFVMSTAPYRPGVRLGQLVATVRPGRFRLPSRAEPGSRLRIQVGDLGGSDPAAILSLGATLLVVHLASRGLLGDPPVELRRPLHAWKAFASDPSCRATARLNPGGERSAIDLQRHYLAAVERHLAALPGWAPELCGQWRSALDRLAAGQQVGWIEWQRRLERSERRIRLEPTWKELGGWNDRWAAVLREAGVDRNAVTSESDPAAVDQAVARWVAAGGPGAQGALGYLRVRRGVAELDAESDRVGLGDHTDGLVGPEQIENARVSAPPDTRAAVRGKWVRRLGATEQRVRFRCDWHGVWDQIAGTSIDLSDPEAARAEWRPEGAATGQGDLFSGLRDWLDRF
ncbi:MAG: proteasome accessory factor PafA2 family protein [Gemmatimonadales bacterium]